MWCRVQGWESYICFVVPGVASFFVAAMLAVSCKQWVVRMAGGEDKLEDSVRAHLSKPMLPPYPSSWMGAKHITPMVGQ